MWIYFLTLLLSIIFAKLAVSAKPYEALRNTYRLFAVFSFLPFAFNAMLRGRVGTDWIVYNAYYYEISNGGRSFSEPLFNLLNKILYSISANSALLFATVSFITLLLFFMGIFQNSEMVPYSILLFFATGKYFSSLNQIRQMLAMSIFFYAWKYIKERRPGKYFSCLLAACLIHSSSAIFMPLYFLYGIRYDARRVLRIAGYYCLALPLILVCSPILVRLTRFAWYMDSRFANNFDLIGFTLSALIASFHVWLLYRQENADDGPEPGFMTMLSVMSCLLYFLTSAIPQVTRIAEAYSVLQILSIPNLISGEKNMYIRQAMPAVCALLFICKLLYNVYSTQWWYGVLPYHTLFYPI